MKKLSTICFFLCFFLLAQGLTVSVAAQDASIDASIVYGCNTVDAKMPFLGADTPVENTESAILFEANSNTLMCAWNADAPMYPASLVKIMTALIAIEQGTMTDAVTVTQEVLDTLPQNAVTVGLLADDVIGVQDLLYCMLVGSANDAAAVIANHIGGSQESFVTKMNQRAQELGCTNTSFTDAHGLDEQQYTTARDVVRVLLEALKSPLFYEIFGTVHYEVPATNKSDVRDLSTGNYLLNDDHVAIYLDSRVTGGRTGLTDNGDRCIATVAEENNMQLISVTFGSKSIYKEDGHTVSIFGGYKETSELLDKGFDGHEAVQLFYPNQALLQRKVDNGNADVILGPQIAASTVLPVGFKQTNLTYKYTDGTFQLPIEKDSKQSNVQVWYGSVCVAQADLYAMNHVELQQQNTGVIDTPKGNGKILKIVLIIVGTILACVLIGLVLLRLIANVHFAVARKRSRQRRKNRRRSR